MKKLLVSLFLFGTCLVSQSQTPIPGSYETNSDVDKLVGGWRWTSGADTFELKLEKFKHDNGVYSSDLILGTHLYIKNGVTIENSMSEYDSIVTDHKKATVYIYNSNTRPDLFEGQLKDISKAKSVSIKLLYKSCSPPEIEMHVEPNEGVSSTPNFEYGVTAPEDLVLIKQ